MLQVEDRDLYIVTLSQNEKITELSSDAQHLETVIMFMFFTHGKMSDVKYFSCVLAKVSE